MAFHWSLSDSKSPQLSRTLLSILAVLSNAVIWIVSTHPPTSTSARPFNNTVVIVPKALITIGTVVTFMFSSFLNSLERSRYLSFFSHSFNFILWSAGTAKSANLFYYYYCYYFTPLRLFHNSVNLWFFIRVWVTESLLKSQGLFSVFWLILVMQLSG